MPGIAWDISVTGFLDLSSGVLLGIFLSSAEIILGIFMEFSSEVLFGIRRVAVTFLEYCLDFPPNFHGLELCWELPSISTDSGIPLVLAKTCQDA